MSTLNAQVRPADAKGKQLRRDGIVPAVLFGKHLDESISIQIPKGDVEQFLRFNSIGSKLDLMIGKKKYMALLKGITYTPIVKAVEHVSFLAMTAGEKVSSVMHVVLHNSEKVDGLINHVTNEIPYKALPAKLVESVEIDLAGKVVGDSVSIADLDIAKNADIEILLPLDTLIFTVAARVTAAAEALAESEAADAAEASAEATAADEEKTE